LAEIYQLKQHGISFVAQSHCFFAKAILIEAKANPFKPKNLVFMGGNHVFLKRDSFFCSHGQSFRSNLDKSSLKKYFLYNVFTILW